MSVNSPSLEQLAIPGHSKDAISRFAPARIMQSGNDYASNSQI
jgi:hypothetical protein